MGDHLHNEIVRQAVGDLRLGHPRHHVFQDFAETAQIFLGYVTKWLTARHTAYLLFSPAYARADSRVTMEQKEGII